MVVLEASGASVAVVFFVGMASIYFVLLIYRLPLTRPLKSCRWALKWVWVVVGVEMEEEEEEVTLEVDVVVSNRAYPITRR